MKLIVTGATGFVGTEVIRQAIRNPAVTSVIALARKPVVAPQNFGLDGNITKFKSIVLSDWTSPYSSSVKSQIQDADACIWTLAVTPSASKGMDFADVTKICFDFTLNGMSNMAAVAHKPFRFIYVSGVTIERDQSKTDLSFLADYRLMRGRVENSLLDFAKKHSPNIQVTAAKPGAIDGPGREAATDAMVRGLFAMFGHTPKVHVSELAAAMIDQCLNGIMKDPLLSSDLVEIGQLALRSEDYLT